MGFYKGYILRARYQIIKELGRGGWGVTYLAEDIELPNRPYRVIKEITPSPYLKQEQNQALFENEANALYVLGKHPRIPQIFARFEQDTKFYLIQEYISGSNLEQELSKRTSFTELEVIRLLREILLILQVVHRHNYIHRDIKPSNLICSKKKQNIFLIDFGAVKELPSTKYTDEGKYTSTVVIGTPGYMPAEQIAKSPKHTSDIYALGITMIRLLTGLKPPVNSATNHDCKNRMIFDSRNGEVVWQERLDRVNPIKINPKTAAILSKMVRYDFRDRYQSVESILKDLDPLKTTERIYYPPLKKKTAWVGFLAAGLGGLVMGILLTKIIPLIATPKTKDYAIDFNEVCNHPSVKGEVFQEHEGYPEFFAYNKNKLIWPVFKWKCGFSKQGQADYEEIIGMDLDRYCLEEYSNLGYRYEAYFKNYLDKNSWYCTNVGTKFETSLPIINKNDRISSGEEMLHSNLPLQKQATEFFAEQKYQEAANTFLKSWQEEAKNPQTLIYLNNALLELSGTEYYTIAVTVPITSNLSEDLGVKNINLADEMLRGVAQAQTEVNLGIQIDRLPGKEFLQPNNIKEKGLKIVIADDQNDPQQAKNIANKLIEQTDILGVVGHYASDTTITTIDLFNESETTLISPGSTSEELTQPHRQFFFRTIPTVTDTGEALANYLINERKLKQAAIFYNPESPYTRSIKKEFKQVFQAKGGHVSLEYDRFHKQGFDATQALKEIEAQKDIAIVLFPDGQVTHAVNNSLEIIESNNSNNWIVGSATVYNPKTLEIGQIKALEKLVVAVPWHSLNSPNSQFPSNSEQLWSGGVNHRTALAYDAARTLIQGITTLLAKSEPVTRVNMQKTIASPDFSTQGAIGTIRFTPNGNRRNPFVQLVKVIKCDRASQKMQFVPLAFGACASSK